MRDSHTPYFFLRFDVADVPTGRKQAIGNLCNEEVKQVRNGIEVPILSGKAVDIDTFKGTTRMPPTAAVKDVIFGKHLVDADENGHSATFPYLAVLRNVDSANSFIHQIVSGRFGVRPEFLVAGKQTEIKMVPIA